MKVKRISRVTVVAAVAALVAVPLAQSAASDRVQIDGRLVAPAQVSAAQVAAGTGASAYLAQVGGKLVEPSQMSAAQSSYALPAPSTATSEGSSSDFGVLDIAIAAMLAAALFAASALVVRMRRRPVAA